MSDRQSLTFDRAPESVRAARGALDAVGDRLPPGQLHDASLCLSELVSNAIKHSPATAGEQLVLNVELADAGPLRVEVVDPGTEFDPPDPTAGDEGGWGLYIVEQVSSRWGVLRGDTTTVWFEIDVMRDDAASRPPTD